MSTALQLSARAVAELLAHIFGPSFYDGPRFGGGDPRLLASLELAERRGLDPWVAVMLNPQPLPPKARFALAVADAHLADFVALDRFGALSGAEVAERTAERGVRLAQELDELCPRWPHWPKGWPPPPPPPWADEVMTAPELFLYGTRFVAAAGVVEQPRLRNALAQVGEKALGLSMRGQTGR